MSNPNPSPLTRFKPGENGRQKKAGDRDRLTSKFLYELAESFELNGRNAIEAVMLMDTPKYLQIVAALVPKEIEIVRPLDGMNDGELTAAIQALTEALRAQAPPTEDQPDQPTVN